jgi:hypothetical protein
MSIIRPILRMCVVAALRERTLAESRVFDSDNTPLADALIREPEEAKPYITVYTDEDTRPAISGRDVYAAERNLSLVLEIGAASAVVMRRDDGSNEIALQIPATDAGLELSVDIVESQALAALVGDPQSRWGELFRRMVLRIERVQGQRGGSAERGSRWAARQIILICDVIADAPPGVPQPAVVRDFLAAVRAAPPELGLAGAAEIIERALDPTAALTWRQAQAWLGLTEQAVRATGVAPPLGVEEEVRLAEGEHVEGLAIVAGIDRGRPGTGTIPEPPP